MGFLREEGEKYLLTWQWARDFALLLLLCLLPQSKLVDFCVLEGEAVEERSEGCDGVREEEEEDWGVEGLVLPAVLSLLAVSESPNEASPSDPSRREEEE